LISNGLGLFANNVGSEVCLWAVCKQCGFLAAFGDIPLWHILAFYVLLPLVAGAKLGAVPLSRETGSSPWVEGRDTKGVLRDSRYGL